MTVWGLKSCDTCRRALRALSAAGFAPRFVDLRADGVTPDDLARFHAKFGADLVNRRSATWRGLDAAARTRPAVLLIGQHPALMKRPVIEHGGRLLLGWAGDVRAALGVAG